MKAPLLLLTVVLHVELGGCALSSLCSQPPSKWCSSLDSAIQCGVRFTQDVGLLSYLMLLKMLFLCAVSCVC